MVEDLEFKGAKGKSSTIAIAWKSLEHHLKSMMTEEVVDCLPLIGGAAEDIEMHHIRFCQE